MKLKTKLILSFSLVAVITLVVAAIGYWQANKLASALYEVGAVRLPSIQGLDAINEGLTSIRATEQVLLDPGLDAVAVGELLEQERRAWARVEKGWRLYEPLPQTPEENAKWRAFVPAWRAWQAEHQGVMNLTYAYRLRPDAASLARARAQSRTAERLARNAASLLAEVTAINDTVAATAKKNSVAGRQDLRTVKYLMFGTAVVGFVGAIALGILLGRRISQPLEKMGEGFAAIARGDLSVNLKVHANDEIGRAKQAMNSMVEVLRNAQATVRAISDNLPDCMLYQVVLDYDGVMRFQYLSAGIERLHGVTVAAALRDPDLLYRRILEEDRAALHAAEAASLAGLTAFNVVVRMRLADGQVRWRHLCSQPRRLEDGRVQWHGIELDVTDRKLAEEALRESEALMRSAMQDSPIGMALVAPAGDWLKVNPALCAIVGYSLGELLATDWQTITHPDDLLQERTFLQQLLAGEGEGGEYEKRFLRRDGQAVWVQMNVSTVRNDAGTISYFVCQYQDITARRAAALALRESEARFRLLVSNSTVGMMMFAPDLTKLEVNPALCRILGYSREELLGLDFVGVATHPDDREASLQQHARLMAGEIDSYEVEKRYLRKDGQVIWANLHVSTMRDTRDCTVCYVAQIQDINARKLAEESLKAALEKLQLALQASRLGIGQRDLRTGLVEWDSRFFEIFGQPYRTPGPSIIESDSWVIPEDQPILLAARKNLLSGAESGGVQFRIRRPDGEIRFVSTHAVIQTDQSGKPAAVIGVVADLTDLVHAMEESGRLREKLRQSQKMETLGTLAAGIAHDFNNLLTGINGFVELGVSTLPPDHEAIEMLKQARNGATSARDLVRRILDFSRRVPDAERTVVQLAGFVRDSAPLITAGLPDQVALSFAMEDDTPPVRADTSQIQQVLMNLCVNGAHAIGDHGGTVRIGLCLRQVATEGGNDATARPIRPGRYACLSVTDTGCGMSAEVCARIFEQFYTTKAAGVGTGLGLSVVQDIVVDHGGFIQVQSEPGRGTTFEILLPAAEGTVAPFSVRPSGPMTRGQMERILVVDDEPSITAVAQRALTDAGYAPEVFGSALEAWEKFAAAPDRYDLLLLDHQMPDLTGAEFAGRARQVMAALPIVVMTGRIDEVEPAELHRLGRIEILAKPFVIEELLGQVASALDSPAPTSAG